MVYNNRVVLRCHGVLLLWQDLHAWRLPGAGTGVAQHISTIGYGPIISRQNSLNWPDAAWLGHIVSGKGGWLRTCCGAFLLGRRRGRPSRRPTLVAAVGVVDPGVAAVVGHDAPYRAAVRVVQVFLPGVGRVRRGPALIPALGVVQARLVAGRGRGGEGGHEEQGQERGEQAAPPGRVAAAIPGIFQPIGSTFDHADQLSMAGPKSSPGPVARLAPAPRPRPRPGRPEDKSANAKGVPAINRNPLKSLVGHQGLEP